MGHFPICAHHPRLILDKPLKFSEPQCFHLQNGSEVTLLPPPATVLLKNLGFCILTAGWHTVGMSQRWSTPTYGLLAMCSPSCRPIWALVSPRSLGVAGAAGALPTSLALTSSVEALLTFSGQNLCFFPQPPEPRPPDC